MLNFYISMNLMLQSVFSKFKIRLNSCEISRQSVLLCCLGVIMVLK